jgi:dTDP-4-amino-4,6-dideoxygalactose transaminase
MEKRSELEKLLLTRGIETAVHYPTPIHLQPAAKRLGYKFGDFPITEKQAGMILTLPINQSLGQSEIERICVAINEYYS